ncbi:hypothetical protein E4U53_004617, partial [Claviceps sorghi]
MRLRGLARLVRPRGTRGFASTGGRRERVAFVGLGQMGYPMARNLQSKLRPTDAVSLFDINAQAMERLEAETRAAGGGAKVELAGSARAAAREADIVVTVLPEPRHVRDVYGGMLGGDGDGDGDGKRKARVFIDCSTVDPATSRA